MILLDISIFILSFISVCWSAESPSNKEYNRPPLTSHTFYPPSCLDQEYKNVRAKKKVHRRPPLTSQTFIPPPPSEQRFLAQQSQIAAAPTLQKKFEFIFQEEKNVNNLLRGDNLLLSKIFADATDLSRYIIYTTITTTSSYVTSTFVHDIDPSITQVINDKLQELYSWSCSLDSPDIPLPKFSVPPHEIFQFNYQEGIVSFQLGQYLTIRTNGPKAHPLNKSILPLPLTRNNFGCNVFDPQYVTDLFCDYCQAGMHVLDIGSGAGANAFAALKKGAKVTAIDLSADNLELLWGSIILEYRQNLWLTVNPFPEKTTFFENSFNAILMSHVAHYLTGAQLRLGIEKIYKWLNLEEFFFFQALTPYSNPYLWNAFHMDVVAKYGQEWPGYFRDEKKELMHRHNLTVEPHIPGCMPNFGHPIHPYIIERELKRVGFEIVYLNYGSFSPLLSQKYPVTYQEIEAYVKGSMNSADQLNLESNLQVTYPELLCILKQDQIKYQELIKNQRNNNKPHQGWTWENISPSYRGASLQSMENVIAVAIKRERRQ